MPAHTRFNSGRTGILMLCQTEVLALYDDDFVDFVTSGDHIHYVNTFHHFAEAGVVSIEMRGSLAAVADEKLRTTGIASGVGHGENATVVKLLFSSYFTWDLVTGAATARAFRTAALDDKVGEYPVEIQPVVKAFVGQIHKVFYGFRRLFFVKFGLHETFFSMNFGVYHS